jgi:hypothetical protein
MKPGTPCVMYPLFIETGALTPVKDCEPVITGKSAGPEWTV